MRYKGPKNKLARRGKTDLSLKTAGSKSQSNLLKRINIIPGEQGTRRSRKLTDYGIQLREKQKLKRVYGLTEKQMKNYFIKASRVKGNTTEVMLEFLEKRLDNVLYRLCFSPTRASARQLVNHGHILVNNKKVSIPSFQVSVSDVVSTKDKTLNIPYISASIQKSDAIIPFLGLGGRTPLCGIGVTSTILSTSTLSALIAFNDASRPGPIPQI